MVWRAVKLATGRFHFFHRSSGSLGNPGVLGVPESWESRESRSLGSLGSPGVSNCKLYLCQRYIILETLVQGLSLGYRYQKTQVTIGHLGILLDNSKQYMAKSSELSLIRLVAVLLQCRVCAHCSLHNNVEQLQAKALTALPDQKVKL